MKLLDLVASREALQRLISLELPAATSFAIARTVRPIQAELQSYEQARVMLVRKLGEERDGQISVPLDKLTEFNVEHLALLDVELKLDINLLSPDILGETPVMSADLMALWFLFEEAK